MVYLVREPLKAPGLLSIKKAVKWPTVQSARWVATRQGEQGRDRERLEEEAQGEEGLQIVDWTFRRDSPSP